MKTEEKELIKTQYEARLSSIVDFLPLNAVETFILIVDEIVREFSYTSISEYREVEDFCFSIAFGRPIKRFN